MDATCGLSIAILGLNLLELCCGDHKCSNQWRFYQSGRNINSLRYADDTTLMAKSEEELKSLLMTVKEKSEKVGLNFNIQKTKIMASGPITSSQTDGETMETVTDFIWGGGGGAPKSLQMVTATMKLKGAYSLEEKL